MTHKNITATNDHSPVLVRFNDIQIGDLFYNPEFLRDNLLLKISTKKCFWFEGNELLDRHDGTECYVVIREINIEYNKG